MAKKKVKKKKKTKPMDQGAFMADMVAAAEREFGTEHMYVADKHDQRYTGLPLPSLALEYLLYSNVLYLGSVYGIAGPPASFKSSLGLEFAKMICSAGGIGSLAETEGGKISPAIVKSVLGEHSNRLLMKITSSVEAAQTYLTKMIEWFQEHHHDKTKLYGLFLDSLFGSGGEEKMKKITEEGHAGRSFPVEALLWSQWFQLFAPKFVGWPMVMVFVNHQKRDIDSSYKGSYRHPGGDAQEFYSTVYMHVKRLKVNDGADQRVVELELRTVKHSFAPFDRRILLPFVADKTVKPNRLFFDWGHATANLLTDAKKCPNIANIINVTQTSPSMTALTRRFSCKKLGLKDVTGAVLGAAVHQDSELMSDLRDALDIEKHAIWDGCMPVAISSTTEVVAGEHDDVEVADGSDLDI